MAQLNHQRVQKAGSNPGIHFQLVRDGSTLLEIACKVASIEARHFAINSSAWAVRSSGFAFSFGVNVIIRVAIFASC
jgi:hypothetical protein